MDLIDRPELVTALLACATPIIVLDAPAGMGKTSLLTLIARRLSLEIATSPLAPSLPPEGGMTLWDIPPYAAPAPIPEQIFQGIGQLIVAKRPDVVLPGLSRARAYGHARVFDSRELMVSADELQALFADAAGAIAERSGGWPLLVFGKDAPGGMQDFLLSEMLAPMPDESLADLAILLDGGVPKANADALLPFARTEPGGTLTITSPALVVDLAAAVSLAIEARLHRPGSITAIARAFHAHGRTVEAIAILQRAGLLDQALALFQTAGGLFFHYYFGPKAFDAVLAGFPLTFAVQSEVIVIARALQALKLGDMARARRLLIDRFGDQAHDLETVFSPRSSFSREFRAFRLLMLLYEDVLFTEGLVEKAYALVAEFPLDDHLFRGSFYNSVLEFYIRSRRFAAAEEVAQRAMFHYQQARAPHLAFYISLHQALIRLMTGDALTARKHAQQSAEFLRLMGFESPNDARLQVLLEACLEYEGGRAEPLARFLSLDIDDFAHGEIWPSLLEFALHYGSHALGEHVSPLAARAFLDRWRVHQASNGQFQTMIGIREATVLQNANRWQEAAEHLGALPGRIDRTFVMAGGEALARLQERDELAAAFAWLRQIVYEMPQREGLASLIETVIGNLNMTDRQRMSAEIWLAYAAKRQRNLTRARAVLQKTFGDCVRLGTIAPLAEERIFVQELIENQRIGGFLATVAANRQIIRKLRDVGRLSHDTIASNLLSRRESKILIMISEGAANKFVAHTLGLSEATVKFHLGNVYRKLGCRNRQEAIGSARALGLLH